jgi:hypothetical protein
MTRQFCDRCGREIGYLLTDINAKNGRQEWIKSFRARLELSIGSGSSIDLCQACHESLSKLFEIWRSGR